MWMKHDQNKESTIGRANEGGLLRCPMCKGRGFFEPTQVPNPKNSGDPLPKEVEVSSNELVKLPRLQGKPENKKESKARYKYSLPSINNARNLTESNLDNRSETCLNVPKVKRNNFERKGKTEPRIKTGGSRELSIDSSNDSSFEKPILPSPRTPKNPSETLKICLSRLKTNNWTESVNALKEILQISRFYPQLLETNMVAVYRGIIFLMKSFRSLVVRTACQAANELLAAMANTQRPEFDELVNVLLQKTADTNKAVRQDANEALDTLVINIPPIHTVRTIVQKGITHKSPIVRSATARLLVCLVGVVGVDSVFVGNKEIRRRIVYSAATFMQDGCQEVRNYGKRLMKMLMTHDDFDEVLQTEVNEILLKRIEKTLITMRYKT